MDQAREADWARRLKPIDLQGEAIPEQMERRSGALAVLSTLVLGIMAFFQAIFTGFGYWWIGMAIDLGLVTPPLAWLWFSHWRLNRKVSAYLAEVFDESAEKPAPRHA